MGKRLILRFLVLSAVILFSASAAFAAYWTDWTSTTAGAPEVLGTLNIGGSPVNVNFSGVYSFAQTSGGTDYWTPSAPYISATVANAPPAADIIGLNTGGTGTISFSAPVLNPLLALVSWNSNTVDFGAPIQFLSYGAGYWGNGTPVMNAGGTGFFGSGEVHGVIELVGSYSSITFTHTSENWHGFTVGALGLGGPPTGVPEPATMALLGLGMLGIAGIRRKFRS